MQPEATASIINCTFANNQGGSAGAAVYGPANLVNCAIGNHTGEPCSGLQSVAYSCAPSPCSELGPGNLVADPLFLDADGADGIQGTADDDLRLAPDSACIDAGDSTALPADEFDLDEDHDFSEPLPLDLFGNARMLDLPTAPDTGVSGTSGAIVDIGACEYRRPGDTWPPIGDGLVNVDDLTTVLLSWGPCPEPLGRSAQPSCPADIHGDGEVGVDDLLTVLDQWD